MMVILITTRTTLAITISQVTAVGGSDLTHRYKIEGAMAKEKVYKPKGLIAGYKIGTQFTGMILVAVPQKSAEKNCIVAYENKIMRLLGKDPVERLQFSDKYGRGSYWLYYYEWIPEKIWDTDN